MVGWFLVRRFWKGDLCGLGVRWEARMDELKIVFDEQRWKRDGQGDEG